MNYSRVVYCVRFLLILPVCLLLSSLKLHHHKEHRVYSQMMLVDYSKEIGLTKVVDLAEAFKATLTKEQSALLQRAYSKTDAVRWSNFPQAFSRPNRVGLNLGTLNAAQLTAFKALMSSVLTQNIANEGYDELEGVRAADDYLGKATKQSDTFGAGNYYIAFLGQPSITELWELQYGGHHFAFSNTYDKGKITGATPSFRGVEPMKPVTANGKIYQPLEQEQEAFANLIKTLTDTEKGTAKLTSSFNDVILGPGQDGKFPAKKLGFKVGNLNHAQQELVIKAIELYVNDLNVATAQDIMKKYRTELPDTYISYSGSGTMNQAADYIRIDGSSVWIEYAAQSSRDFPGTTHPHSVWRDHKSDYGGN